MMGPGLKVALWHWLIRGKGQLFAKIRENQLQALKVWEKHKKRKKEQVGFEPATYCLLGRRLNLLSQTFTCYT